jgi:hypothetical protein
VFVPLVPLTLTDCIRNQSRTPVNENAANRPRLKRRGPSPASHWQIPGKPFPTRRGGQAEEVSQALRGAEQPRLSNGLVINNRGGFRLSTEEPVRGCRTSLTRWFYEGKCQEKIFPRRAEAGREFVLAFSPSRALCRCVVTSGPRVTGAAGTGGYVPMLTGHTQFPRLAKEGDRRPSGGGRRPLVSTTCFPS